MSTESYHQIARDIIKQGHLADIRATGLSMFPTFTPHFIHRVKQCSPSAIRRGEIIVYESSNGRWIAHRVVENTGETIICRGDSVTHLDAPINYNDVVGEVVATKFFGIQLGLKWWGAMFYGRLLLACHPVSTYVNHFGAWCIGFIIRAFNKIFK